MADVHNSGNMPLFKLIGITGHHKQNRVRIHADNGVEVPALLFRKLQILAVGGFPCIDHGIVAAEYHGLVCFGGKAANAVGSVGEHLNAQRGILGRSNCAADG